MNFNTLKLDSPNQGMFSRVNYLINHLHLAEENGYTFRVKWNKSVYRDSDDVNMWNRFFEQPFDNIKRESKQIAELDFYDRIISPRKHLIVKNGSEQLFLLPPKDRNKVKQYIDRYIKLKPRIKKKCNRFIKNRLQGHVIGVHIRGRGRKGGGTSFLRKKYDCIDGVPFELYFKHISNQLKIRPKSKIFLCSDSQFVIGTCKKKYKNIIVHKSKRTFTGEPHLRLGGDKKQRLGDDILIETYALSKCNVLIHGISNISNYILCNNPNIKSCFVYEKEYKKMGL